MDRRQKDIMTMAEHAELAVVGCEKKNSRQYATLVAENGVKRTFSISIGSKGDARGDLNELGAMKRFSRENRVLPGTPPADPRMPAAPAVPPQSPFPVESPRKPRTMTTEPKKTTMKLPTKTATVSALTPVDFYKVCEWAKAQELATVPCLEAMAMLAGQRLGQAVPEDEMKLVMDTIGIKEPAHWSEPTDPHAIVARELLHIMKKLGEEPSPPEPLPTPPPRPAACGPFAFRGLHAPSQRRPTLHTAKPPVPGHRAEAEPRHPARAPAGLQPAQPYG